VYNKLEIMTTEIIPTVAENTIAEAQAQPDQTAENFSRRARLALAVGGAIATGAGILMAGELPMVDTALELKARVNISGALIVAGLVGLAVGIIGKKPTK
jgi:hypothetical protein